MISNLRKQNTWKYFANKKAWRLLASSATLQLKINSTSTLLYYMEEWNDHEGISAWRFQGNLENLGLPFGREKRILVARKESTAALPRSTRPKYPCRTFFGMVSTFRSLLCFSGSFLLVESRYYPWFSFPFQQNLRLTRRHPSSGAFLGIGWGMEEVRAALLVLAVLQYANRSPFCGIWDAGWV